MPPKLSINPPLLNSACPWATTQENLRDLLEHPCTGGVTVRTSILASQGFDHRPAHHRYVFFDVPTGRPHSRGSADGPRPAGLWSSTGNDEIDAAATASLNTLGYSPISLGAYLDMLARLGQDLPHVRGRDKTIILSVAGGSAQEVRRCYDLVARRAGGIRFPLAVEINLSCPNIEGAPPPAYDARQVREYLDALPDQREQPRQQHLSHEKAIPVGIKMPPFTYQGQFQVLAEALRAGTAASKISFITATNTLGSCLLLGGSGSDGDGGGGGGAAGGDKEHQTRPVLPGPGIGGMAGPPLHPLALGNVALLRQALDSDQDLARIDVIGVGGVGDAAGYKRMRAAGAAAVAVGTALGRRGMTVFDEIAAGVKGDWEIYGSKL